MKRIRACVPATIALLLLGCVEVPGDGPPTTAKKPPPSIADLQFTASFEDYMNAQYDSAVQKLLPLTESLDQNDASRAVFWIGECHLSMGHMDEAGAWFREVIEKYPGTKSAGRSLERLDLIKARTSAGQPAAH